MIEWILHNVYIHLCKPNLIFIPYFGLLGTHSHTSEGENPRFFIFDNSRSYISSVLSNSPVTQPKTTLTSVVILQQTWSTSRYHDAFAWSATACWRQVCCKLSIDLLQVDCYPQACYKLFQQVVIQLQTTRCNKPDFNRLVSTWWVCCNLLTNRLNWQLATSLWRFGLCTVNSKRTGTLTQYNSPYNRMKPS